MFAKEKNFKNYFNNEKYKFNSKTHLHELQIGLHIGALSWTSKYEEKIIRHLRGKGLAQKTDGIRLENEIRMNQTNLTLALVWIKGNNTKKGS